MTEPEMDSSMFNAGVQRGYHEASQRADIYLQRHGYALLAEDLRPHMAESGPAYTFQGERAQVLAKCFVWFSSGILAGLFVGVAMMLRFIHA